MSKKTINLFVAAFLFLCWLALEMSGASAGWSQPAKASMILFLLTAFLWVTEIVPLFITSFVVLLIELVWIFPLLTATGGDASKSMFLAPFFSDIILLFMGGFVLSDLLNRYGISRWLALHFLGGELSHPSRAILMLMLISAFFSMWISNTATAAMILALTAPLASAEAASASPNIRRLLPISVAFACNIGGLATPIGTPPNAIVLVYLRKAGMQTSFLDWMLVMTPFAIIMLLLIWRLLIWLYPVDSIPTDALKNTSAKPAPFSGKQKAVCAVFLLTVISWITTGLHPLTSGEVSLAMIIAVFGFGLLKVDDFRNLSWNILIILGGGMALGVAVEASGLAFRILELVSAGAGHGGGLLASVLGVASVLSTFISNTAAANLIAPVAYKLSDLGFEALLGIAVFCSTSMSLTISTPPNVLASSMGGLNAKDLFIPGIIITLLSAVLFLPLLYYAQAVLGL